MQLFHFFTASLLFGFATGSGFLIRLDWTRDCDFRGYAPGGKVKTISKIEALKELWSNCIKASNPARADRCQMDAVKSLLSQRPYFAPHEAKVLAMKKLNSFERRRVEASLVLFRDYANLVIMELTPLINKFCEDRYSHRDKSNCKRFSKAMNTQVNFFIKFAQNAIKLIEAANGKYGVCPETITCGPQHVIKEGWIKVHTANWFECKCVIEDANTKQYCKVRGTIRKDGRHLTDYYYYDYNVRTDEQAAKEFAGVITKGEAAKYQNQNRPIVKKYWEKNVLLMIPTWRKALEKAQYGMRLSDEEENDEVEEEMNDGSSLSWYKYSKEFEARMKKAGLKL